MAVLRAIRRPGWDSVGLLAGLLIFLAVTGCARNSSSLGKPGFDRDELLQLQKGTQTEKSADSSPDQQDQETSEKEGDSPQEKPEKSQLFRGSDQFYDWQAATRPAGEGPSQGGVTLNFEQASLREVVKTVLGDILGENYTIDPAVKGKITVHTERPLSKDALIPTLEKLLKMHNVALVYSAEAYKVLPQSKAVPGNLSPRLGVMPQPPGYQVRIIPLEYIGASEMHKLLKPFLSKGSMLRVDKQRNLLIVAGTKKEVNRLRQTVDIFDVDILEGMSVGIFRLDHVEAKKVAEEMKKLFGQNGTSPVAGMFRFIPVDRLNAIMIVTPQSDYLEKAKTWLSRLDRTAKQNAGRQLFVYAVQNGKAENLAENLNKLLGAQQQKQDVSGGEVAPGRQQAEVETQGSQGQKQGVVSSGQELATGRVKVIADKPNNALLVLATPEDYSKIQDALSRLDVTPRQVLIQTTIAEVTLTGDLQYGLQWFFRNELPGEFSGSGDINLGTAGEVATDVGSGFAYSVIDSAGEVRALFESLAQDSLLEVLSSPSIMVLDNHEAKINVGDEVPIQTASQTTQAGNTIRQIQFRETGVILEVSPRVNSGGLVTLEVSQEVTDVGNIVESLGQFRFNQRSYNSTIAVEEGETVVLGGLIETNRRRSGAGVPVLRNLPLIGGLFGSRSRSRERRELVVLLTPHVMTGGQANQEILNAVQHKMQYIFPQGQAQPSPVQGGSSKGTSNND